MCEHPTVKCLDCGEEGSPAKLLASRTSEARAAASRENGKKGGRPKKVIVAVLFALLIFPARSHADDWTKTDTALEAAYTVAHVLDWAQTRWIAAHPHTYTYTNNGTVATVTETVNSEVNPVIGNHPSIGRVNTYFASTLAAHALISYGLRKAGWKVAGVPVVTAWQSITIAVETAQVGRNISVGIGMQF